MNWHTSYTKFGVNNLRFANYKHVLRVLGSLPQEHAASTRPVRGEPQALAVDV
jgi:hypothetical protein